MQEERNGITLTILQEKGGCGKSCAIFNIADYLSKKKNVLIIDLDGQAADISYFLFGNKVGDSQDPMRSDVKTIMHIFRGTDPEDVIVPVKDNLDIVEKTEAISKEVIEECIKGKKVDFTGIKVKIRERLSAYFNEETGSVPMIITVILEI